MSNERSDDATISVDIAHSSLNILDIIRFLSNLKLAYLGDEIATEIIVNYNAGVDAQYYISDGMTGADIREQFNKLPNAIKQVAAKRIVIADELSKVFIMQIIRNSNEQYEFFVQDSEIRGSLINTFSIVSIVICVLLYFSYTSTTEFRGEVGATVSDKVGEIIGQYLNIVSTPK